MTLTPKQQLVEPVAIALCSWLNGKKRSDPPAVIWARLTEEYKDAYREQAQAALDACHAVEMHQGLKLAKVRLKIALGRAQACHHETGRHDVTVHEMPDWNEEMDALLAKLDGVPSGVAV